MKSCARCTMDLSSILFGAKFGNYPSQKNTLEKQKKKVWHQSGPKRHGNAF